MKLRTPALAVLSIAVLFAVIGMSMLIGYWRTESSKIPARYESGEFAGEYNPADIRGSYSLEDIYKAFDVPVETLSSAFGLENQEAASALRGKILEDVYGKISGKEIGTDSVRLFVALYLSRPYTVEETTGLPLQALDLLVQEGRIGGDTASEFVRTVGVDIESRLPGAEVVQYEEEPAGGDSAESEEAEIKGKTTFKELMDWGLSEQEIEEIIGMPMGPATQAVRDYFMDQGLEFSTVKEEVQRRLDER